MSSAPRSSRAPDVCQAEGLPLQWRVCDDIIRCSATSADKFAQVCVSQSRARFVFFRMRRGRERSRLSGPDIDSCKVSGCMGRNENNVLDIMNNLATYAITCRAARLLMENASRTGCVPPGEVGAGIAHHGDVVRLRWMPCMARGFTQRTNLLNIGVSHSSGEGLFPPPARWDTPIDSWVWKNALRHPWWCIRYGRQAESRNGSHAAYCEHVFSSCRISVAGFHGLLSRWRDAHSNKRVVLQGPPACSEA